MSGNKLVSVLCPCGNSEKYIHRLLNSVLGQTYPNVEMIVVDDGSTDTSCEIVLSFVPKFEAKGFSLALVQQGKEGKSVAINNGLKQIHGDYLVWPDAEDYYSTEEAFSKMVGALESASDDFKMVRCQGVMVKEPLMEPLKELGERRPYKEEASLFEDCIFHLNGFYYCPGGYMVDMNTLREETNLDIYTDPNGGENWQLMLPVLYKHRCLTISEQMCHVVIRPDTPSWGQFIGFTLEMNRNDGYERVLIQTLKRIKGLPSDKLDEYIRGINQKYTLARLEIALCYVNRDAIRENLAVIEERHIPLALSTKLICKIVCLPVFYEMYLVYKRVKRKETF